MPKSFMVVSVEINLDAIAGDITEQVGEGMETPETVKKWIDDNRPRLAGFIQDAVVGELVEAYDV